MVVSAQAHAGVPATYQSVPGPALPPAGPLFRAAGPGHSDSTLRTLVLLPLTYLHPVGRWAVIDESPRNKDKPKGPESIMPTVTFVGGFW